MHTSAVEWPTLREAMKVETTKRRRSRADDNEWGGKVWDGVTDWFI